MGNTEEFSKLLTDLVESLLGTVNPDALEGAKQMSKFDEFIKNTAENLKCEVENVKRFLPIVNGGLVVLYSTCDEIKTVLISGNKKGLTNCLQHLTDTLAKEVNND